MILVVSLHLEITTTKKNTLIRNNKRFRTTSKKVIRHYTQQLAEVEQEIRADKQFNKSHSQPNKKIGTTSRENTTESNRLNDVVLILQ